MSEGGGDSGMMMVVVLIMAVMSSCCAAAGAIGLMMYKNPNFLSDLLGNINPSTPGASSAGPPGPAPTPDQCTAQARTACEGKRGKERETCISSAKRTCLASGTSTATSTAAGGCGDATVELFKDEKYVKSLGKAKCGEYANLKDQGWDENVSSMKIPSNLKVFSYNEPNFGGKIGVWKNNIGKVGGDLKDEFSSLKVVPVTETNPPTYAGEWVGDTA